MPAYALSDAKALLSRAVDEANRGEEVIILKHGRPVAKIVPFDERRKPILGAARGKIRFLPGWDDPTNEVDLIGE